MKKRVLSLITVLAMTVGMLAGCGGSADKASADTKTETDAEPTTTEGEASLADVKVGFIFLHDENSTYDLNFMNAAKEACEKLGVEYMTKTNIPEGQECYEAACELADARTRCTRKPEVPARWRSRALPAFPHPAQRTAPFR